MASPGIAPAGARHPRIDVDDVQGVVLRGYGEMPAARFAVFVIKDAVAARAWLARVVDRREITSARPSHDGHAMNVAFTRAGFEELGLASDTIALFSREFLEGMVDPDRSVFLGDVDQDEPRHWSWGREQIHGVVMMYAGARDAPEFAEYEANFEDALAVVHTVTSLTPESRREHFGFRDGISQPHVRHDNPAPEVSGVLRGGPDANAVNAGEFLLGYLDEFGCYQPSPLLERDADADRHLVRGEDGYPDFGRNGSYLVLRQLEQNVFAFWSFVQRAAKSVEHEPDWVAAKMIGRWLDGAPLTVHPHCDPGSERPIENDFEYALADQAGQRCPVGAHIRRSNPRDSAEKQADGVTLFPEPFDRPTRVANRHRLIRRGRPYGDFVGPDVLARLRAPGTNADPADNAERGLLFAAVVGSIRRQFEFVQTTWCNNPTFQGLVDEPDPLIGGGTSAVPNACFTIPSSVPSRLKEVPRFITVKGGAYFFLPSLRALRYLGHLSA